MYRYPFTPFFDVCKQQHASSRLLAALPGLLLVAAGLLAGGIAFERVRYGAVQRAPQGPDWRETSERFIDDASGKPVSVWFDAKTGERRYVAMEHPDVK